MQITIPYFIVTAAAGILALLYQNIVQTNIVKGQKKYSGKFVFLLILVLLASFAAFRHINAIAIDEYAYRNRFNSFSGMTFSEVMESYEYGYEPIFQWIVWLSTRMFHTNQGVLIITGTLITIGFILSIRKYCIEDFAYAVILFFVTGSFFSSFNGIQQYASVVIFILFFDRFYEHRFIPSVIITVICFLTHNAGFLILAYYFLLKIDFGTSKMYILDALFVLALFIVYLSLPELRLGETLSMMSRYTVRDHGINIVSLLIAMVPAGFAIVLGPRIDRNDKCTLAMGQMAVINAMLCLLCLKDTYIARIAMFTGFFSTIFLVRSMKYISNRSTAALIKLLSIALYSIVFALQNSDVYYFFQLS